MTDTLSLTGVVATAPRQFSTSSGLAITSFRLASSQRRFDRARNAWVDGETNWYTVNTFRALADHVAASLSKGDRVVLAGRLRIRAWEKDDKSGTAVEVDADTVGHDLFWGTSSFTKAAPAKTQHDGAGGAPGEAFESGPGQSATMQSAPGQQENGQPQPAQSAPGQPTPVSHSPLGWALPGEEPRLVEGPVATATIAASAAAAEPRASDDEPSPSPGDWVPASDDDLPF